MDECVFDSTKILIEDLTDDMYVNTLVKPFIDRRVENETFNPEFITNQVLPEIENAILKGKKSVFSTIPNIISLLFDNFPEDGFSILKKKIFPVLKESLKSGGIRKFNDISELCIEIYSSIPHYFRDTLLVNAINDLKSSHSPRFRILACKLIPIVSDTDLIFSQFEDLCSDKSAAVRSTIIASLPSCTFSDTVIQKTLINGTNDDCVSVQEAAAAILGKIAPQLVDEFCKLLTNSATTNFALPSVPNVVKYNNFAEIFDSFMVAMEKDKNDAAVALLETVEVTEVKKEAELYLEAAKKLVSFYPFTWKIHSFSKSFEDKSAFLKIIDPSGIENWRTRFALLKQCEEFVPELGKSLENIAETFSEDSIAYVRDESVNLWADLIKIGGLEKSVVAERLMRGKWQKRIVLAKVIREVGQFGMEKTIEKLKNDEVENVRHLIHEIVIN